VRGVDERTLARGLGYGAREKTTKRGGENLKRESGKVFGGIPLSESRKNQPRIALCTTKEKKGVGWVREGTAVIEEAVARGGALIVDWSGQV